MPSTYPEKIEEHAKLFPRDATVDLTGSFNLSTVDLETANKAFAVMEASEHTTNIVLTRSPDGARVNATFTVKLGIKDFLVWLAAKPRMTKEQRDAAVKRARETSSAVTKQ